MLKRHRVKQALSLQDRLAAFAEDARKKASDLPAGQERDELLKKAGRADTASHISAWANSPGLQAPK
jgi:hypothetical protein